MKKASDSKLNLEPLISIIVPVYNSSEFVTPCLESILTQSYRNIELIIINDGSTDNSLEICEVYTTRDSRVRLFSQPNSGPSVARNLGIKYAQGDYITFVDSDDRLERYSLGKVVKILLNNDVDVLRTNYSLHHRHSISRVISSTPLRQGLYSKDEINTITESMCLGYVPGYVWLLTIKRESLAPNVRFNPDIMMMEDLVFCVDLLNSIDRLMIDNTVTHHHFVRSGSVSRSVTRIHQIIDDILDVNNMLQRKVPFRNNSELTAQLNGTSCRSIVSQIIILEYRPLKVLRRITAALKRNGRYRQLVASSDDERLSRYERLCVRLSVKNSLLLSLIIKIRFLAKQIRKVIVSPAKKEFV